MKNRKGFTLVEIMIVVAIIALLAAIAIPNLLGARRTANNAGMKAALKVVSTDLETYAAGAGNGAYLASLPVATYSSGKYCAAPCTTAATGCGGYIYTCTLATTGYTVAVTALSTATGDCTAASITTGGITSFTGC